MNRHAPLAGHAPWSAGTASPDETLREMAAQQEAFYTCARDHVFKVTFAAEAQPPDGWDCRCGSPAALNGTPGAEAGADLPAYDRYARRGLLTHRDQLLARRTIPELEALLAERLAAIRGAA